MRLTRFFQTRQLILSVVCLSMFAGCAAFKLKDPPDEMMLDTIMLQDSSGLSRYPYIASLRVPTPKRNSRHICGGVLISSSHVLAPASCLVDKVVFNPEIHLGRAYPVMSEQSQNSEFAEIIFTEKVHFPPGFSITNSSSTQDLALLELQRPSQYLPVSIPPRNVPIAMLKKQPRLRSMGWAPTGLAKDDFFMDVTVLNGPLEGPKRSFGAASEASRSLLWADSKVPAAWCGPEAGRLLVVRSPAGHAQDGDVLVGMQSSEGPSECLRSTEAVAGGIIAPRPMAFTPLAGPGSNLDWVNAIVAEHGRGPGALIEDGARADEGQQQEQHEEERADRGLQQAAGDGAGCGTTGSGDFHDLQLEDC